MEPTWISLLPPLAAIALAIWTRKVLPSLMAGVFLGWTIDAGWNPLVGFARTMEGLVSVFKDSGNTRVILFCSLVGGLIMLIQRSGGAEGFILRAVRRGQLKNHRLLQLSAALVGMLIFVETSISCLLVGTVYRPLFDRAGISREKLAYISDSTSAPVNLLVPLNAWGAYIFGLLAAENIANPLNLLLKALPFNFYAILAVGIVFAVIITGKDIGPMKKTARVKEKLHLSKYTLQTNLQTNHKIQKEKIQNKKNKDAKQDRPVKPREDIDSSGDTARTGSGGDILQVTPKPGITPRARYMMLPVLVMMLVMPLGLWITGKGNLMAGSGSTAVLWAVTIAIISAGLLYAIEGVLRFPETVEMTVKGIGSMVPLVLLLVTAFALGDVTRQLKTGIYVAGMASEMVTPFLIPLILFLLGCVIAFCTGTSWGTFALMMPIAVPLATASGQPVHLLVAAVLGGGLFGDHCSPISDTTIVASMAASCDHIAHVRTQLPYALAAAVITSILYLIMGIVLL
ncbi:MAG: sodium:solute symporter [bacterium]|nr:sodium:solute symporter [bacterium]